MPSPTPTPFRNVTVNVRLVIPAPVTCTEPQALLPSSTSAVADATLHPVALTATPGVRKNELLATLNWGLPDNLTSVGNEPKFDPVKFQFEELVVPVDPPKR